MVPDVLTESSEGEEDFQQVIVIVLPSFNNNSFVKCGIIHLPNVTVNSSTYILTIDLLNLSF